MMQRIKLPFRVPRPILACGADLKGAFSLAKGSEAFFVNGFGDLSDPDNLERYEAAIKRCRKRFAVRVKTVAFDMHQGYFSARFAENLARSAPGIKPSAVQHHEAHVASSIVDNSIKGDVIGVAFDGTGYGPDGNVWGGEFFVGRPGDFKRAAHFEYVPMPGGEMAIRQPWRMALSYLYRAYGENFLRLKIDFLKRLNAAKWKVLKAMIDKRINSPLTSSAGRLFDAVASIVFARYDAVSEAELPIGLEKLASESCRDSYDLDIETDNALSIIKISPIIRGVVKDLSKNIDGFIISSRFHNTIASVILKVASMLKKRYAIDRVVLSGGVFQNRFLTARTTQVLKESGFETYLKSRIETNDAGISMGQVAIASARG